MGFSDYSDYSDNYGYSGFSTSSYNNGIDEKTATALGGFFIAMILISVGICILYVIANWKIFTKAGEEGWKSIIPFYNSYILFKIVWDVKYFWIFFGLGIASGVIAFIPFINLLCFLISAVLIIISVMLNYYLARSFGQGIAYTVGLVFFGPIFILVIAFSQNYVGNGYEITQKEKGIIANPTVNMV